MAGFYWTIRQARKAKAGRENQINSARFFSIEDTKEGAIRCTLCPHRCLLGSKTENKAEGLCHVRTINDGVLELTHYGFLSALARDPIEKKPLYHWRPGSSIVSVGFFGCNLRCPFCQNWRISQINIDKPPSGGFRLQPDALIAEVTANTQTNTKYNDDSQIAYTYSEPLVHAEYLLDCMEAAHNNGIANVLVTNGCVNKEAAEAILSHTDAANIDLKCFSKKTYSGVLGGNLTTVLDFIQLAVSLEVHVEITTLVVPGLNDGEAELMEIAEFIAELVAKNHSVSIPWHLSAYHRDWKWDAPPTNPAALTAIANKARNILAHVYTGNIAGEHNDTMCGQCGATLVKRRGYSIDTSGIRLPATQQKKAPAFYLCASCGAESPLRYT